jgi:transposase-like protein
MVEDNFPETLQEVIKHFSDEAVCIQFFASIRWVDAIAVCPNCNSTETSFLSTRKVWKCKGCKKQFSIKVGTILEGSNVGLDKWICAIWLITNAKNGISSYEIHRSIGVTQKTAWFMLHRIRLAMQTGSFEKLSGNVEVDETFIGGKAKNMHKHKREAII